MKRAFTWLFCSWACIMTAQSTEAEWLLKAGKYFDEKNYSSALDAYLQAYQLNNSNTTAITRILFIQNELQNHDAAADFLHALPLETIVSNEQITQELVYTFKRSKKYEQQIALLEKAIDLVPGHVGLLAALATVYCNNKQYEQAVSTFTELAGNTRPDQDDYVHWCYALNELRIFDVAVNVGKEAIAAYPHNAPLHRETGYAYRELKKYQKARKYLVRSTKLQEDDPTSWQYLGELYLQASRINTGLALQCFVSVVNLKKATAKTYYYMGWCYNELNNYTMALDNLRRSIELNDQDGNSHLEMGYTYYKLRNFPEAISSLKKSIELSPRSDLAHYYAGLTYRMLKDPVNLQKSYDTLKALGSNRSARLERFLPKN